MYVKLLGTTANHDDYEHELFAFSLALVDSLGGNLSVVGYSNSSTTIYTLLK